MIKDALLDVSRRGDIVVDLFAGSGSTLMAAEHCGRTAYGMDIDPAYCRNVGTRETSSLKS